MRKWLKRLTGISFDTEGLFCTEATLCLVARKGNRLYVKRPLESYYRPYAKFKNASRAKKYMARMVFDCGLERMVASGSTEVYLSRRLL